MLVLGGVHGAAQCIRHLPELSFVADVGGDLRLLLCALLLGHCFLLCLIPKPPNGHGVERVAEAHAGFAVVQYYAGREALARRGGQFRESRNQ